MNPMTAIAIIVCKNRTVSKKSNRTAKPSVLHLLTLNHMTITLSGTGQSSTEKGQTNQSQTVQN